MTRWYDWDRTMSYGARITMVIGGKGIGKTLGLRHKALRRAVNRDDRFVEISRRTKSLPGIERNWAGKLELLDMVPEGYEYSTKSHILRGTCGDVSRDLGYFASLNDLEDVKTGTYPGVQWVIMDEVLIDRRLNPTHHYKRGEWELLGKLIDSIVREDGRDSKRQKPRLFLLSNAVSLDNPYFRVLGIDRIPEYGYHWYLDKQFLLHFVDPHDYEGIGDGTLSGIMLGAVDKRDESFNNRFADADTAFIEPRPSNLKFCYTLVYCGRKVGVWIERTDAARVYMDGRHMADGVAYALTPDDARPDRITATRQSGMLKLLCNLYYAGRLIYSDVSTRALTLEMLAPYGLH